MRTPIILDHMIRYPYVATPDQGVLSAIEYMEELSIRHLPVLELDRLVGIVSDRDLKAAAARGSNPPVSEIMCKDVYVVTSTTPLADVANDMADGKFGSAVVVDAIGKVIGIFTTTDALRILGSRLEDEAIGSFLTDLDDYTDEVSLMKVL